MNNQANSHTADDVGRTYFIILFLKNTRKNSRQHRQNASTRLSAAVIFTRTFISFFCPSSERFHRAKFSTPDLTPSLAHSPREYAKAAALFASSFGAETSCR